MDFRRGDCWSHGNAGELQAIHIAALYGFKEVCEALLNGGGWGLVALALPKDSGLKHPTRGRVYLPIGSTPMSIARPSRGGDLEGKALSQRLRFEP